MLKDKKWIKPILLLLFSIIMAFFASYFAFSRIEKKEALLSEMLNRKEEMHQIIVPLRDIQSGEILSSENLSMFEIPIKFIPTEAILASNFNDIDGLQASVNLEQGKPIVFSQIKNTLNAGKLSNFLKEGERAITLPVDSISGNEIFLKNGDKIDLIFSLKVKDKKNKMIHPLWILENAAILATGSDFSVGRLEGEKEIQSYASITIAVKDQNIEKLISYREAAILGEINIGFLLKNDSDKTSVTKIFQRPVYNVQSGRNKKIVVFEGNQNGKIEKKNLFVQ